MTKEIGITGGIGSGKSFVSNIFKSIGVPIYNSDNEAKKILNNDSRVIVEIIKLFGEKSYINGIYNTKFISSKVFKDKKLLNKLNNITHPIIYEHYKKWVSEQKTEYIIIESAILIETGIYKNLSDIIVVEAPEEIRINRVISRGDYITKVIERINNQMSDDCRSNYATYSIINDGTIYLKEQVYKINNLILNKKN